MNISCSGINTTGTNLVTAITTNLDIVDVTTSVVSKFNVSVRNSNTKIMNLPEFHEIEKKLKFPQSRDMPGIVKGDLSFHYSGAGVVLHTHKDLLMVKGNHRFGKWGIPKGKLENNDKSYFDCAIRETQEETGYDLREILKYHSQISRIMNIHIIYKTMDDSILSYIIYIIPISFNDIRLPVNFDSQEICDVKWFDIRELRRKNCMTHMTKKLLQKIGYV